MVNPLLSILIPTVVGREQEFNKLLQRVADLGNLYHKFEFAVSGYPDDVLRGGYNGEFCEVRFLRDNKEMTIGEKREKLYQLAKGKYSWQIDDDDDISDNSIGLILEVIRSNPEVPCITFKENCMMNGVYQTSNHSIKYDKWQDNFDGYDYVRTPFYKDVIRTDIAKSVPFPNIRYGEDEQWSYAIKPLLTSEIHIDEEIYYYIYEPKDTHNERYGIIH